MNAAFSFGGLLGLLAALAVFMVLQRVLHREIQAFLLLLTRRSGISQVVFALLFLPGVFLHELSHLLMAKLLGVPTGKFSLVPQAQPNGRLRLGYVETGSGGFLRDALIGVAPLLTGCALVAVVAVWGMQLLPLWAALRAADWSLLWAGLLVLPQHPDFWLWSYLAFTISSTMMPSSSDRQAWLPVGLLAAGMVGVAILAGAGPWMLTHLALPVNTLLTALALIFALSGSLHLLLTLPFWLLHRLLARLSGLEVA